MYRTDKPFFLIIRLQGTLEVTLSQSNNYCNFSLCSMAAGGFADSDMPHLWSWNYMKKDTVKFLSQRWSLKNLSNTCGCNKKLSFSVKQVGLVESCSLQFHCLIEADSFRTYPHSLPTYSHNVWRPLFSSALIMMVLIGI